ncbi:MAG TPA: BON domain-containing protein [Blastocatellia bacterium]|nr:BON domain-containing protein [Blastocatellia bacterium]
MRRLVVAVLSLLIATSVYAVQEGGSGKSKAEKPADCSSVADATITDNVKASLAKAPSLKDANIDVTTSAGVVTLKGVVKTAGLKGVATRMARRVDCVKKVDNQLTAERPPSRGSKKSG